MMPMPFINIVDNSSVRGYVFRIFHLSQSVQVTMGFEETDQAMEEYLNEFD